MNGIGDGVTGTAHHVAVGRQVLDERLDLVFVGDQEFQVVATGEAQIAVAELVSDLAYVPDPVGADQARRTHPHGIELVSRFGHVFEQTGLDALVIFPLAVVLLDDRWQHVAVIGWAKVCSASHLASPPRDPRSSRDWRAARGSSAARAAGPPP